MHILLNRERSPSHSEAICEKRSEVSNSHSDTQQQILTTLRDLAGKMDYFRPQEMGRSTQSVVFSKNYFLSYQEEKCNPPDAISLHAHDYLFVSNEQS